MACNISLYSVVFTLREVLLRAVGDNHFHYTWHYEGSCSFLDLVATQLHSFSLENILNCRYIILQNLGCDTFSVLYFSIRFCNSQHLDQLKWALIQINEWIVILASYLGTCFLYIFFFSFHGWLSMLNGCHSEVSLILPYPKIFWDVFLKVGPSLKWKVWVLVDPDEHVKTL